MGQTIDLTKQEAEDEKEANDALNALVEMAEKNLELFEFQVKDSSDTHRVQINKIITSGKLIQCQVEKNSEGLKGAVDGLLGNITNGDFKGAITTVVGVGLDTLLSNYMGNISTHTSSTVSVGVLGNFYKIDYYMFSYQYTSDSLSNISKNVVCCAVIISSVKTEDLKRTDVDNILVMSFGELPLDQLKKLQEEAYEALGWNDEPNDLTELIELNKQGKLKLERDIADDDDQKEDMPENNQGGCGCVLM